MVAVDASRNKTRNYLNKRFAKTDIGAAAVFCGVLFILFIICFYCIFVGRNVRFAVLETKVIKKFKQVFVHTNYLWWVFSAMV